MKTYILDITGICVEKDEIENTTIHICRDGEWCEIPFNEDDIVNIEEQMNMSKVNRDTRAGANGKAIQCPTCGHHSVVYHFAWGAITCQGCKTMVDKQDFLVVPREQNQ